MKPRPGWEWSHNQFGSEPCCPVSLEAPLDEVGCVGHLQARASKDVYLGFPKESSPMLPGGGGPQLDVLLESSPQGIAGLAMAGLGVLFPPSPPAQSSVGRAVHASLYGHDSAEAPFRRFPWKPDSQHEEGAFQRELQPQWWPGQSWDKWLSLGVSCPGSVRGTGMLWKAVSSCCLIPERLFPPL